MSDKFSVLLLTGNFAHVNNSSVIKLNNLGPFESRLAINSRTLANIAAIEVPAAAATAAELLDDELRPKFEQNEDGQWDRDEDEADDREDGNETGGKALGQ